MDDAQTTDAGGKALSPRRRSRQAALQGLYQWLISREDLGAIQAHTELQDAHRGCDRGHFEALLQGCVQHARDLDHALSRHLDRPLAGLSPVEHAALLIGAYELQHCLDIPYRVVINEAVELTKAFGGTDGHKYVNGVLDRTAGDLRPLEVQARRAARAGKTAPPSSA
jgi:N utilization substance protein B